MVIIINNNNNNNNINDDDNNNNNNNKMVYKYQFDVQRGLTNYFMPREGFLALVGNLSSDSVTIKILVGSNLKMHLIILSNQEV